MCETADLVDHHTSVYENLTHEDDIATKLMIQKIKIYTINSVQNCSTVLTHCSIYFWYNAQLHNVWIYSSFSSKTRWQNLADACNAQVLITLVVVSDCQHNGQHQLVTSH